MKNMLLVVMLMLGLNANSAPVATAATRTVQKLVLTDEGPRILPIEEEVDGRVGILDVVTEESVQATIRSLNEKAKYSQHLTLVINSPGGSVFDGAELIAAMRSLQASGVQVDTVCLNLCASMAAIIHQYGSKRYMQEYAVLMFHPASGGARGEVDTMLSRLETIAKYVDRFGAEIAARVGIPASQLKQEEKNELWLNDKEALSRNFSDGTKYVGRP
jgi:ATP-dependent protease ClpP protease subunit